MKKLYILFLFCTAFTQAQNTNLELSVDGNFCHPGDCANIVATYTQTHETTSYTVAAIPYQNLYPYTGGTVLDNQNDDVWSPQFTLPFNFCFYGQSYNSILIGSNGLITFDVTAFQPLIAGICPWSFSTNIPSSSFPVKNAIYGVYQDTDIRSVVLTNPAIQNVNYYIGGTAPNRYFVVNFNELPTFMCNSSAGLQSSQVILYETTNAIDVYIKKRTPCSSWQSGRGVVGIQNAAGTLATVPPNRNTGNWSTTNEAWRFTPSGAATSSISWMLNDTPADSNTNTLNICPEQSGNVTAIVTYAANCGNPTEAITSTLAFEVFNGLGSATPSDLYACSESGSSAFNLTVNDAIIPGPANNFELLYYTSLTDAQNYDVNYISNPENFIGTDGQVIYIRLTDIGGINGCTDILPFTLHVTLPSGAPAGATVQYFTAGQTLADLAITGQNIQWFATATGGDPLPSTTVLVSGTTYYAAQANAFVCDEPLRSAQAASRLAVTAYDIALGTQAFTDIKVSVTPNPVKDFLTVESAQPITAISLYNIQGQLVSASKESKLKSVVDCSGLANGIYMLRIQTQQGIKGLKIVKQ